MSHKTPESLVLSSCLKYLEVRGIYHWRNSTGAVRVRPGQFLRFGKVGSSDIFGVLSDGRFLAVECKASTGRLTPEQKIFLEKIRGLGGVAVVVKSWKELDQALLEAGYAMKDMPLFEGNNALLYSGA
jgi:hypothetical protein